MQEIKELGVADVPSGGTSGVPATTGEPIDPADLQLAATLYEDLARDLGPLKFGERELALSVAAFAKLIEEAATQTRRLAAAVRRDERAEVAQLTSELTSLSARVRTRALLLDQTCVKP